MRNSFKWCFIFSALLTAQAARADDLMVADQACIEKKVTQCALQYTMEISTEARAPKHPPDPVCPDGYLGGPVTERLDFGRRLWIKTRSCKLTDIEKVWSVPDAYLEKCRRVIGMFPSAFPHLGPGCLKPWR